jgi:hypothetical protein
VHRAFGFHSSGSDHVAVEITNDTAVPFAVVLSVRPVNPLGDAPVHHIDVDDDVVLVDGKPAMYLGRAPARAATGTAATGDVVHAVLDTQAVEGWAGPVECREGRASAAFVFPLAHTATLRAVLPVASRAGRPGSVGVRDTVLSAPVPPPAQVAKGWTAQVEAGMRAELPDERLAVAFAAARRHLLLSHGGEDLATWPERPAPWTDLASVGTALDRLGHHVAAEQVLATLSDRQSLDGYVIGVRDDLSANGAALYALGEHWLLTRDADLVERLVGPTAKAGHWIDKRRRARRGRRLADAALPDLLWSLAGLDRAAAMLEANGQPDVAEDLARFALELRRELDAAVTRAAELNGSEVLPASLRGEVDGRVAANLVAGSLGVLAPDDPRLLATAEWVLARQEIDGALFDTWSREGLSPLLTLWAAGVEMGAGRGEAGLHRLRRVLDLSSSTWAWPRHVHPRSGGGSAGDGHHAPTTAEFCSSIRRLLVTENDHELLLAPIVPDQWLGVGWEAHDIPTRFGRFGFAIRWHGDRPAILWELDTHVGVAPPSLRAMGLDPGWSGSGPAGEALLSPVTPAQPVRRSESPGESEASPASFG